MNFRNRLVLALAFGSLLSAPLPPLLAQGGPLTPLTPPGVTMKSLTEIDPGTPLNPADAPFTINAPGSYYLTGNITGVSGNGASAITISSDNVTLDLRGFEIVYNSGTNAYAVQLTDFSPPAIQNVVVRNGSIRGAWTGGGVSGLGPGNSAHDSLFEDLRVTGASGTGIGVGSGCQVRRCHVAAASTIGISASSSCLIEDCIVTATVNASFQAIVAGEQSVVRDCVAYNNANEGIVVGARSLVSGCVAASNGSRGILLLGTAPATVRDCIVYDNGHDGINTKGPVENCTARLNGNHGIVTNYGSVTNSSALENGGSGFFAMRSVSGCFSQGNTLHGFDLLGAATAFNSVADGNTKNGFELSSGASVQNCAAYNNTLAGFNGLDSCSIANCSANQNDTGGFVLNDSCTVSNVTSYFNSDGSSSGVGIQVRKDCVLINNLCNFNFVAGIFAVSGNRIDSNNTSNNPNGILVTGTENLVVRNFSRNSAFNNYSIPVGNFNAQILIGPTAGFFASNAWANFSD